MGKRVRGQRSFRKQGQREVGGEQGREDSGEGAALKGKSPFPQE